MITLAALVPLLVFGTFAALEAQRSYRALDEARLSGTARALAAAVDARLNAYVTALTVFSSARTLNEPLNPAAFAARGRQVGAALGGSLALFTAGQSQPLHAEAADPPGNPAMDAPPLPAPAAAALARVFAEGRPAVSDLLDPDPLAGPGEGEAGFLILVPVEREGRVPAALALRLQPVALRRLLADQGLAAGSFAAIADGGLRLIASTLDPEGERQGRTAPSWVSAAMGGRERGVITGPGLSDAEVTIAFEYLDAAPGWSVAVAQPVAVQRAAVRNALSWAAGAAAAIAGGLMVLVWGNRREALRNARAESAALQSGRAEVERLHAGLPAVIFLRSVGSDDFSRRLYQGGDIEAVTGWPAATIHGASDLIGFSEPGRASMPEMIRQARRDGSLTVDWRMRRPDGTWHWMRSSLRFLESRPDGSGLVVGYILNVTAEREAAARANAAGRLASLGEMATGLAHELKQPLAIASMAAENARRAASRGDLVGVERRLATIAAQMERSGAIIDHLRRFAGGSAPGAPPGPVALATVVEGVRGLVGGTLREAQVAMEVALGPEPPVVLGHLVPLEQVLLNLLTNARDAMATLPRGMPRRVRIAATAAAGRVRLTVADTGGGIPPALIEHVFEPFVTTKGPDRGTGLGLAICFGLVRGMGGSIAVRNDAAGAVFTIELPEAPPGTPGETVAGTLAEAPAGAPAKASAGAPAKASAEAPDAASAGGPAKPPAGDATGARLPAAAS